MVEYAVNSYPASTITDATVSEMHNFVKLAKTDADFVKLITYIVRNCKGRDDLGQLRRLYDAFYSKIKYLRDPYQVERVQSVWETMDNRAGDCDDSSVLMAAAAGSIGYKYRFVTIKCDKTRPEEWSHVFTQVFTPRNGIITLDISLPKSDFNFLPTGFEEKIWPEVMY
jgi:transglutaminase-like putative cysteine protease